MKRSNAKQTSGGGVKGAGGRGGVLRRAEDVYACLRTLASVTGGRAQVKECDEDSFLSLQVELFPDDGHYRGGTFPFKIVLEHEDSKLQYPRDPPVVIFTGNGLLHPNVDPNNGRVCLSLLQQDNWNPSKNSLDDVINGLMYLMYNPNFNDPLWGSRTEWRYTEKRGEFAERAQEAMQGGRVQGHQFSKVKVSSPDKSSRDRLSITGCENWVTTTPSGSAQNCIQSSSRGPAMDQSLQRKTLVHSNGTMWSDSRTRSGKIIKSFQIFSPPASPCIPHESSSSPVEIRRMTRKVTEKLSEKGDPQGKGKAVPDSQVQSVARKLPTRSSIGKGGTLANAEFNSPILSLDMSLTRSRSKTQTAALATSAEQSMVQHRSANSKTKGKIPSTAVVPRKNDSPTMPRLTVDPDIYAFSTSESVLPDSLQMQDIYYPRFSPVSMSPKSPSTFERINDITLDVQPAIVDVPCSKKKVNENKKGKRKHAGSDSSKSQDPLSKKPRVNAQTTTPKKYGPYPSRTESNVPINISKSPDSPPMGIQKRKTSSSSSSANSQHISDMKINGARLRVLSKSGNFLIETSQLCDQSATREPDLDQPKKTDTKRKKNTKKQKLDPPVVTMPQASESDMTRSLKIFLTKLNSQFWLSRMGNEKIREIEEIDCDSGINVSDDFESLSPQSSRLDDSVKKDDDTDKETGNTSVGNTAMSGAQLDGRIDDLPSGNISAEERKTCPKPKARRRIKRYNPWLRLKPKKRRVPKGMRQEAARKGELQKPRQLQIAEASSILDCVKLVTDPGITRAFEIRPLRVMVTRLSKKQCDEFSQNNIKEDGQNKEKQNDKSGKGTKRPQGTRNSYSSSTVFLKNSSQSHAKTVDTKSKEATGRNSTTSDEHNPRKTKHEKKGGKPASDSRQNGDKKKATRSSSQRNSGQTKKATNQQASKNMAKKTDSLKNAMKSNTPKKKINGREGAKKGADKSSKCNERGNADGAKSKKTPEPWKVVQTKGKSSRSQNLKRTVPNSGGNGKAKSSRNSVKKAKLSQQQTISKNRSKLAPDASARKKGIINEKIPSTRVVNSKKVLDTKINKKGITKISTISKSKVVNVARNKKVNNRKSATESKGIKNTKQTTKTHAASSMVTKTKNTSVAKKERNSRTKTSSQVVIKSKKASNAGCNIKCNTGTKTVQARVKAITSMQTKGSEVTKIAEVATVAHVPTRIQHPRHAQKALTCAINSDGPKGKGHKEVAKEQAPGVSPNSNAATTQGKPSRVTAVNKTWSPKVVPVRRNTRSHPYSDHFQLSETEPQPTEREGSPGEVQGRSQTILIDRSNADSQPLLLTLHLDFSHSKQLEYTLNITCLPKT